VAAYQGGTTIMTKLGLALPTSGSGASPEAITDIAEGAERLGLASVWTFERLMRPIGGATPVGGGDDVPLPEGYGCVYDPVETLAYVAARTTAITLGTSVLDRAARRPRHPGGQGEVRPLTHPWRVPATMRGTHRRRDLELPRQARNGPPRTRAGLTN
jgi:hypothetical protein